MDWAIRQYEDDSPNRAKLVKFAEMLEENSAKGFYYRVRDTYFDFGQDWKWTTIIAYGGNSSWQALSPRGQENVLLAQTEEEIEECLKEYFAGKYCQDVRKVG